ncbi:MAG: ZIP family magnesium transporter [Gemmatimonadetes bacterium]|nr:ZIP family magnesium transporter [Gemmatimonadota bacterium]
MPPVYFAALAALGNLLGALALTAPLAASRRALGFVLAFSAGFLVAVALSQLAPEAVIRGGTTAGLWMLIAFALVHLTQHTLVRHFHFGEETHAVSPGVGAAALAGLMLHTFVDGVAIATSLAVSDRVGYVVLTAIVLHKIPEGLAIGSLFVASGRSVRAAVAAGAALGLATIIGAVAAGRAEALVTHGLAISAGVTLYVGGSNLIPEFQGRANWKHHAVFFAGIGAYILTAQLAGI